MRHLSGTATVACARSQQDDHKRRDCMAGQSAGQHLNVLSQLDCATLLTHAQYLQIVQSVGIQET
jgi:hypothetical protein